MLEAMELDDVLEAVELADALELVVLDFTGMFVFIATVKSVSPMRLLRSAGVTMSSRSVCAEGLKPSTLGVSPDVVAAWISTFARMSRSMTESAVVVVQVTVKLSFSPASAL